MSTYEHLKCNLTGIEVDEEEVTNTIMKGFGGGGISDSDGDNMDLTELVAMLLIPTLVRTKRGMKGGNASSSDVGAAVVDESSTEDADAHLENYVGHGNVVDESENNKGENARTVDFGHTSSRGEANSLLETNDSIVVQKNTTDPSTQPNGSNKKLFHSVLQMILADTIHDTTSPPAITVDLLRTIFLFYGEKDVAVDNDLLQSMVDLAKDAGNVLDDKVFAHCLTSDVELYDTDWEEKLQSTYVDVFETHESTKKQRSRFARQSNDDVESTAVMAEKGEDRKVNEVMKKYTFPAIDYAVDTFRSKTYVIVVRFSGSVLCFSKTITHFVSALVYLGSILYKLHVRNTKRRNWISELLPILHHYCSRIFLWRWARSIDLA